MLIKEFCAENFTYVERALNAGVQRIELCDNLVVGGTTPSAGVIEKTVLAAHRSGAAVMTMIRPRGGDFTYRQEELEIMAIDIAVAREKGSDGVVFGCLTSANRLDRPALEYLIGVAEGMAITFHMAFDQLEEAEQWRAIDWLAERKVARILTHGGSSDQPIFAHLEYLKKLVEYAGQRIIILPGGGITDGNCQAVADRLGVAEVHGTRIAGVFDD